MRLDVQLLIYVYMGICVSLLLFNLCYIWLDAADGRRSKHPGRSLLRLEKKIRAFGETGQIGKKEHRRIQKRLSKVRRLERFHWSMEKLMENMPRETAAYLSACEGDFYYLAMAYQKKDEMQKAFLLKLLGVYGIGKSLHYDEIKKMLVKMAGSSSVYTRENALRVLYRSGNVEAVARAFLQMSKNGMFHSGKLLTDGLLSFEGDKKQLAEELWKRRDELSVEYVLAIMQFIRMSQGGYERAFLELLKDKERNQELRLEALRYFRKYRYDPAYPMLLAIMRGWQEVGWEYQAVTALALENYPGEETEEALRKCLSHPNWYVRYNAADTLAGAGMEEARFMDIIEGKDRYAREILQYRLEWGRQRKGEK